MGLVAWGVVIFVALELAFLGVLYVVYALEERALRHRSPVPLRPEPPATEGADRRPDREAA